MSVKRRDKKNRILRDGETKCRDGKYRFTFYENGKQKCFYSWRLERTDPLPLGKRECMALRDKEEELRRSKDRGLAYHLTAKQKKRTNNRKTLILQGKSIVSRRF